MRRILHLSLSAALLTGIVLTGSSEAAPGPRVIELGGVTAFDSRSAQEKLKFLESVPKKERAQVPVPGRTRKTPPRRDPALDRTIPPVQVVRPASDGVQAASPYLYDSTTPSSATGKLYVDSPSDGWSECSAAIVVGRNRSTLMTAAHCFDVPDLRAAYYVPQYEDERAPYGVWSLSTIYMSSCWNSAEGPDCDWAFGLVRPMNGQWIQDVTGANGITFGLRDLNQTDMSPHGYPYRPQHRGFDGQFQVRCGDLADTVTIGQDRFHYSDCLMGPGASGGPWLYQYDKNSRLGIIAGINSFMFCTDRPTCENPSSGIHTTRILSTAAADYDVVSTTISNP